MSVVHKLGKKRDENGVQGERGLTRATEKKRKQYNWRDDMRLGAPRVRLSICTCVYSEAVFFSFLFRSLLRCVCILKDDPVKEGEQKGKSERQRKEAHR